MPDVLSKTLKEFLEYEDPPDFSHHAKQRALDLAIDLGKEDAQKLYHFAVLVTKMA